MFHFSLRLRFLPTALSTSSALYTVVYSDGFLSNFAGDAQMWYSVFVVGLSNIAIFILFPVNRSALF